MEKNKGIKILLAGDITSTGRVSKILKNGKYNLLWNDTKSLVDAHDYAICNLECPLLENGKPIQKVGPNLKGDVNLAKFIKEWGFNAVTLANNHIMDYGWSGLESTIGYCRSVGLCTFGAGANIKDASTPHRIVINDKRISFISAAEEEFCIANERSAGVPPLRPIQMHQRISDEKDHADWVIVIFHGGNEYYSLPRPGLKELCQFMIRAGADVVVGHHPHVPGGYEVYEEKLIFYSLGNLLFDSVKPKPEGWYNGNFLSLHFGESNRQAFELFPYTQGTQQSVGVRLDQRPSVVEKIEDLRRDIENSDRLHDCWEKFCMASNPVPPFFHFVKNQYVKKLIHKSCRLSWLPTKYWTRSVLNRVRCESHREQFITWAEVPCRKRDKN